MTQTPQYELMINGSPPDLSGAVCEGFICEGYCYEGELKTVANVTYIKVAGKWLRMYFEFRQVFWREAQAEPKAWAVVEEGYYYPHVDVAAEAGVVGDRFVGYEMAATKMGSRVVFSFSNGRQIVIEEQNDVTSYVLKLRS